LLPAVQAAREAARRSECQNNLKQIALGALNHEDTHGFYPSGGWGYRWTGDPDMGYGARQPGGWAYSLLEFIEAGNVRRIGQGLPGTGPGGEKYQQLGVLRATVIPMMHCPSRRTPKGYPAVEESNNAAYAQAFAKTDYAGNGGSVYIVGTGPRGTGCLASYPDCAWDGASEQALSDGFDGIITYRSETTVAQVSDGTSKTMLNAEKYLNPNKYETGDDDADNNSLYQGNDIDITRWTPRFDPAVPGTLLQDTVSARQPAVDTPGVGSHQRFGSVHVAGFYAAFCDGSVRLIEYEIDPIAYAALGARNDGQVTD
jgi:hypothetical protein